MSPITQPNHRRMLNFRSRTAVESRHFGLLFQPLYHSLLGILKLYAVYTPYITEYIYQDFFRKYEAEISIHLTIWEIRKENRLLLAFGEHLKGIIGEVRKEKTEKQMSMKDTIPELVIPCPEKFREWYRKSEMDIKACTGAVKILFQNFVM